MASKGIWHSKIEESEDYTISENEGRIVEFENLETEINVFVDEECLLKGTENPKTTLNDTKWILIEEVVWHKLLKKYQEEQKKNYIADLQEKIRTETDNDKKKRLENSLEILEDDTEKEDDNTLEFILQKDRKKNEESRIPIGGKEFLNRIEHHILKKYNGPSITVKGTDIGHVTPGNIYLLMPYTQYPEDNYTTQNVRLVYLIEPYIRYVYVDIPNGKEADIPFFGDKNLHVYGNYATINISTHLLPDCRTVNSKNSQKKSCDIVGFIYFINQQGEEEIVDTFTTKIGTTELNYNYYKNVKVFINPEWQEQEGTHKDTTSPQEYFVKIIAKKGEEYTDITKMYNMFSLEEMTKKVGEGIKELLNPITYDTKINFSYWNTFDKNICDWVQITSMQPSINVRYDTMQMIYENIEKEKNNMINYIGDIEYKIKENNPCAFSIITVNNGQEDIEIFNENKLGSLDGDQTSRFIDIIAGDEKEKNVIVKVSFLNNEKSEPIRTSGRGNRCDKILNDGYEHKTLEDVFKMGWIVGQYVPSKDFKNFIGLSAIRIINAFHPDNEKRAPLLQRFEKQSYKTDQDAKGISVSNEELEEYRALTVAGVQGLTDKDYIIKEGKKIDSIELKLKYKYNKMYEDECAKLLGYTVDVAYSISQINVHSIAWLARYIFMKDSCRQTYFVPVSTCRYPNQIAKIRVYPDFEWWINFNYKAENPVWVRQSPNYKYRVFDTTDEHQNRRLANQRRAEANRNWDINNLKYNLDFEAGFKINGKEQELILGDGFPLLNAIRFLFKAYEIVKKITFADETKEKDEAIGNGTAKTSTGQTPEKEMVARKRARASKGLPFRIELTTPTLSGGIYSKFAQSKKIPHQIGSFYNFELAAKPLFGFSGELDLLYFAQFIGPIGQAMYRISQLVKKVNYLTLGAVRIDYFIYVGFKADLNIELKAIEYHSIDGWDGGEMQVYVPLTFYIEAGVDVTVSIQGIGKGEAEAVIKGTGEFEIRATHDKRNNKAPAFLKFNGLDTKIWFKFDAKSDNKKGEAQPNKNPDHITRILEPRDPWEINIL